MPTSWGSMDKYALVRVVVRRGGGGGRGGKKKGLVDTVLMG